VRDVELFGGPTPWSEVSTLTLMNKVLAVAVAEPTTPSAVTAIGCGVTPGALTACDERGREGAVAQLSVNLMLAGEVLRGWRAARWV